MDNEVPMVLVVGAGPGVSGSLARRYAREGFHVGLVGHDAEVVGALSRELEDLGVTAGWAEADVVDEAGFAVVVAELARGHGRVDVLHFNPSAYRERTPLELTAAELQADVALGVGGLLTAVQAVRPFLVAGARVTATGSVAADRPVAAVASLGVQKAGLRNLVHSLDEALRPEGIRAVSVTVDGLIDRDDPASPLHPDGIAEALFQAARQDEADWRAELRHPAAPSPAQT